MTHAAFRDNIGVFWWMSLMAVDTGDFGFMPHTQRFNCLGSSIMTFGTVVRTQSWACSIHSRGLHSSSGGEKDYKSCKQVFGQWDPLGFDTQFHINNPPGSEMYI